MPPGHPERARFEGVLVGFGLLQRFQMFGGQGTRDLDAAIDVLTRAAGAPQAAPDVRAASEAHLCDAWRSRYEALGDPADLDRAIARARAGAARCPPVTRSGSYARTSLASRRSGWRSGRASRRLRHGGGHARRAADASRLATPPLP